MVPDGAGLKKVVGKKIWECVHIKIISAPFKKPFSSSVSDEPLCICGNQFYVIYD